MYRLLTMLCICLAFASCDGILSSFYTNEEETTTNIPTFSMNELESDILVLEIISYDEIGVEDEPIYQVNFETPFISTDSGDVKVSATCYINMADRDASKESQFYIHQTTQTDGGLGGLIGGDPTLMTYGEFTIEHSETLYTKDLKFVHTYMHNQLNPDTIYHTQFNFHVEGIDTNSVAVATFTFPEFDARPLFRD